MSSRLLRALFFSLLSLPTAGKAAYWGNQFLVESTGQTGLTPQSASVHALRFTQQGNKSIDEIRFYGSLTGTSPLFRFAIEADVAGLPSGTALTYVDSVAVNGWNTLALPPWALTNGTVYHITQRWVSGTYDVSNRFLFEDVIGRPNLIPFDQSADPVLELKYTSDGSSWFGGATPVFVTHYTDGSYFGVPYDQQDILVSVSGATRRGQLITPPVGGLWVDSVGFRVRHSGSAPADSLYFKIQRVSDLAIIASGTLVTPGAVTGAHAWVDASFGTVFLSPAETYRVTLDSPGSSSPRYQVSAGTCVNSAPYVGISFDGINSHGLTSVDSGANWTNYLNYDWHFRLGLGVAGTPTPTYTPSPDLSPTPTFTPGTGGTVLFSDDFSADQGWTYGSEWQRGAAVGVASDPGSDHSVGADNMLAGVVIGGTYTLTVHPAAYLTSPIINLAGKPNVQLNYWRWLRSDYQSYVIETIEAYNGVSWVMLWQNPGCCVAMADTSWTYQQFDVGAYSNANFRLRFGHTVNSSAVTGAGWSVDDIQLVDSTGFTATYTVSPSPTRSITPTRSPSPTASPTSSITSTRSASPTFSTSPTISETWTVSPTYSTSPTFSPSPSISPTWSVTPTPACAWGTNSAADWALGQVTLTGGSSNQGGLSAASLSQPWGVAADGSRLFVADRANNRILIWNSAPASFAQPADRVLGQPNFVSSAMNNGGISAATMNQPYGVASQGGVVVVADQANNRVLIWNSLPGSNGQAADVVLGQPNFTSNAANNGGLSASSMNQPWRVAYAGGKLLVADYGNNRILIWDSLPVSNGQPADRVLGQTLFSTSGTGTSATTLNQPLGVSTDGTRVAVAEFSNHRVLIWNSFPTANGQAADLVLGQPNFTSSLPNNGGLSAQSLNNPYDAAFVGNGLAVADKSNYRVLIFTSFPVTNQAAANSVIGQPNFSSAGIGLSAQNFDWPVQAASIGTQLYVADFNNNRVPIFDCLFDPSPTPTRTATATRTATRTATPSPSASQTWTVSPTHSVSPTFSVSPTISETWTVSPTYSISPTFSPSPTASPTPTVGCGQFGQAGIVTSSGISPNYIFALRFNLATAMTVRSINLYSFGAAGMVRTAIYANGGGNTVGALIQQSGEVPVTMGWINVAIADTPLAPGDYWLAYILNSGVSMTFQAGGAANTESYYLTTYGAFPPSYTADGYQAGTMSIYASDCAAPVLSPTPTRTVSSTYTPTPNVSPTPTFSGSPTPMVAAFPYYEGFESGIRDPEWEFYSSMGLGRVTVDAANGPYAGSYHLTMDVSASVNLNLNEAILHVNLSGQPAVYLEYWVESEGDDNLGLPASFSGHLNGDGVSVSEDGVNWITLHTNFVTGGTLPYFFRSIDLKAAMTTAGFSDLSHIRIKFQQYDDYPYPTDGISWDEIRLAGAPASPTASRTTTPSFSVSPTRSMSPTISPTHTISPTFSVSPTITLTPTPAPFPFADNIESGGGAFAATGLWHMVDTGTAMPWALASSPTRSFWYGQDGTGNFDTGSTNSGTLTLPILSIPAGSTTPQLRFNSWYETESTLTTYDQRWVQISVNGGAFVNVVQFSGDTMSTWLPKIVSLVPYKGSNVQLRFYFNTIDGAANAFRGWYVDDVQVAEFAASPTPTRTISPTFTISLTRTISPTFSASPTPMPTLACTPPTYDQADFALGQPGLNSGQSNQGGSPAAGTMSNPFNVGWDGSRLYVSDFGNNRVLIYNGLPGVSGQAADLVLGQPNLSGATPAGGASGMNLPMGVASDGTRLAVADYGNNRVLLWDSLPSVNGQAADRVLGQVDFSGTSSNSGGISAASLSGPWGIAMGGGKLIVADISNNRVLVWNAWPSVNNQAADRVLGQPNFTSTISAVSAAGMNQPIAVATDGTRIVVGEFGNRRVLLWDSLPVVNGQAADRVLGQPNFTSNGYNTGGLNAQSMTSVYGAALLSDGSLAVTDRDNNRILLWNSWPGVIRQAADRVLGQSGMSSSATHAGLGYTNQYGLSWPAGLAQAQGSLVVADHDNHRALIFDCSLIFTATPTHTYTPSPTISPTFTASQTPGTLCSNNMVADRMQVSPANGLNLDLSAEGSSDWAHWGALGYPSFEHKAGANLISDVTPIGFGATSYGDSDLPNFNWSDGSVQPVAGPVQNGYYTCSLGEGFQLVAPADPTPRRLKVYVGFYSAFGVTAEMQASLSDGSAPIYSDAAVGDGVHSVYVYSFDYKSNSPAESLTLQWVNTNGGCPVFLYAATLQDIADCVPSPTPSATETATPTVTETATPSATPTVTETATPTATPSITETATPTATPTITQTATPSVTPSITETATPTVTPTITQTATPTATPSITETATPTATPTITQTATPSVTPSITETATPSVTPTITQTATPTATPSITETATPSVTPTITQTATPSATPSITETATPSVTPTITQTATPSATPSITQTATPSVTPSITGTATPTATPSITETATPSATPSITETATPSATPSITGTATPTATPSITGTATPSVTQTITPSVTQTITETITRTFTPTPSVTQTITQTSTPTPSITQTITETSTLTPSISQTITQTSTPTPSITQTFTPSYSATPSSTRTDSPSPSATRSATPTGTATPTVTPSPTQSQTRTVSPSPSATVTRSATPMPSGTPTPTPFVTPTPTWTESNTPGPTATAVVPAVLSTNIFRPGLGASLKIDVKPDQDGRVTIRIFNLAGELVQPVFEADVKGGLWFQATWDGRNRDNEVVANGVYFVSVRGGGIQSLRKVIVLR